MNLAPVSTSPRDGASQPTRVTRWAVAMLVSLVTLLVPRLGLADVPGRVGRIAYMEGDVQAYSEADPTWKVAYLNQPITSRNSLFVGDAGRAEISVGSTTLAMDAGSQVDIQQLDDNTFDANVVRGRVAMRVRRLDANDEYRVAVPGADFALLRPGRYRIDALASSGGITVFEGQARAQGDRGDVLVEAGNGLRVALNPSDPDAPPQFLSAAPSTVSLDDWLLARENRFRNSVAERYVSPNMTGYEDLDANGRWSNDEDVGPVWYPTTYVQADWAPYRYGRWAYVAPWGYTWIDDAPWGFAPFHYGRWVQVGSRWGWAPGAYIARPAYAPALVGFYGGENFSASFAIGAGPAVGWYPLAPWQRYTPRYAHNAVYVNQVNNITIINAPRRFGGGDDARDWNREHGGTIAPRDAFSSQRSISRVAVAAPRNVFERARPMDVADLPRPVQVPGAVRRGPDQVRGDAPPDFRSPREFADRPNRSALRNTEPGGRQNAPVVNVPGDRNGGLPPAYRRLPDDRRPNGVIEAGRAQPQGPQVQPLAQDPRSNPGNFNRGNRPQEQATVPSLPQGAPAGEGQGFEQPRFTPRAQPQVRNDGDQRLDQRLPPVPAQPTAFEQQRNFERQNREQRNVQVLPQGQPPQIVEQRQQQRFERPAPMQMQAPQPPAERAAQPRFERPVAPQLPPQPQQMERAQVQRMERPAPPVLAPPPQPVAQPRLPPPQLQPPPQSQPAGRPVVERPVGGPRELNRER